MALVEGTGKNEGKYFWSRPEYGAEFDLGYHHGRVAGIYMMDQEEVRARYFGAMEEEDWFGRDRTVFVFFREKDGKVLRYTSPIASPAMWISDGEDEMGYPTFASSFDREITDKMLKDYILERIRFYEEKDEMARNQRNLDNFRRRLGINDMTGIGVA